jgi:hypothetical protein
MQYILICEYAFSTGTAKGHSIERPLLSKKMSLTSSIPRSITTPHVVRGGYAKLKTQTGLPLSPFLIWLAPVVPFIDLFIQNLNCYNLCNFKRKFITLYAETISQVSISHHTCLRYHNIRCVSTADATRQGKGDRKSPLDLVPTKT